MMWSRHESLVVARLESIARAYQWGRIRCRVCGSKDFKTVDALVAHLAHVHPILPGNGPPCHAKPRAQWCDRDGPGGFMGHTCTVPPLPIIQCPDCPARGRDPDSMRLHAFEMHGHDGVRRMADAIEAAHDAGQWS